MTITIELPPEVEATVIAQATCDGLLLADYVRHLVHDAAEKRRWMEQLAEQPFSVILAPLRRDVEASGMTDDELEALFQQARQEAAQERTRRDPA